MSIEKGLVSIATEVLEDAEREAEKTVVEAEREAESVLRRAKEEAEKTREDLLSEAREEGERDKRKAETSTQGEIRRKLLKAKEQLVENAFGRAVTRLEELVDADEYHDYLQQLILESAENLDLERLVIYVNPKDREWLSDNELKKLSERIGVKLVLAEETKRCMGGCFVTSPDGRVSYDNTIENRLRRFREILRVKVAAILFGEEG